MRSLQLRHHLPWTPRVPPGIGGPSGTPGAPTATVSPKPGSAGPQALGARQEAEKDRGTRPQMPPELTGRALWLRGPFGMDTGRRRDGPAPSWRHLMTLDTGSMAGAQAGAARSVTLFAVTPTGRGAVSSRCTGAVGCLS